MSESQKKIHIDFFMRKIKQKYFQANLLVKIEWT